MRIVDQQVARAPQDMDVREWRARVLTWSGRRAEAEIEYLEILRVSQADPDLWTALGAIYLSEGKIKEAQHAVDTAANLDPKRADLHAARGRVFRAGGLRDEVRLEFTYCFLQHFPYRQIHMIWRLQGLWQYMRGDVVWEPLKRKGLASAQV